MPGFGSRGGFRQIGVSRDRDGTGPMVTAKLAMRTWHSTQTALPPEDHSTGRGVEIDLPLAAPGESTE